MSDFILPQLDENSESSFVPNANRNKTRAVRPLENFKFDWYPAGYKKAELKPTTAEQSNLFMMLPGHRDTKLDPRQNWFMQVKYLRCVRNFKVGDKLLPDVVEIPLLSNWGVANDPVSQLGWDLRKYYKDNQQKMSEYQWLLPSFRYLFLTAYAEPELQLQQERPLVLELPGSYKDGNEDTRASAGYVLASMPNIRDTVRMSANFGKLKYGIICNPADAPVIEIERQGVGKQTTYMPKVVEGVRNPLGNLELLKHLIPLEKLLNEPKLEHFYALLRETVAKDDLMRFLPAALQEGAVELHTAAAPKHTPAPTPVKAVAPKPTPAPAPIKAVVPVQVAQEDSNDADPFQQEVAEVAPVAVAPAAPVVAPTPPPVAVAKPAATPVPAISQSGEKVRVKLPKNPQEVMALIRTLTKLGQHKMVATVETDATELFALLENNVSSAADPIKMSEAAETLSLWEKYKV
jgi:hypothetical protein